MKFLKNLTHLVLKSVANLVQKGTTPVWNFAIFQQNIPHKTKKKTKLIKQKVNKNKSNAFKIFLKLKAKNEYKTNERDYKLMKMLNPITSRSIA